MTDQALVVRQLGELDSRVATLQALAPVDVARLAADPGFAAMVERHVQVAVQAAIDLATWVIADRGWREPRTYADAFYVLADEGFLERPVAYRLADMAGYRNVLVHAYTEVSHPVTARTATAGLADLSEMAARFAAEYAGP